MMMVLVNYLSLRALDSISMVLAAYTLALR
jgi:hypothetical protein